MSLQDDYYEIKEYLEESPPRDQCLHVAFDRIWSAFCALETKEMYQKGEITQRQYIDWLETQEKDDD